MMALLLAEKIIAKAMAFDSDQPIDTWPSHGEV
jgi:hypothetical protein